MCASDLKCPKCGSYATYKYNNIGRCVKCGHMWNLQPQLSDDVEELLEDMFGIIEHCHNEEDLTVTIDLEEVEENYKELKQYISKLESDLKDEKNERALYQKACLALQGDRDKYKSKLDRISEVVKERHFENVFNAIEYSLNEHFTELEKIEMLKYLNKFKSIIEEE